VLVEPDPVGLGVVPVPMLPEPMLPEPVVLPEPMPLAPEPEFVAFRGTIPAGQPLLAWLEELMLELVEPDVPPGTQLPDAPDPIELLGELVLGLVLVCANAGAARIEASVAATRIRFTRGLLKL
jgi:hypothetical protein